MSDAAPPFQNTSIDYRSNLTLDKARSCVSLWNAINRLVVFYPACETMTPRRRYDLPRPQRPSPIWPTGGDGWTQKDWDAAHALSKEQHIAAVQSWQDENNRVRAIENLRCLKHDRDIINRRLPVLFIALRISPPAPLGPCPEHECAMGECARARQEGDRLRKYFAELADLLWGEVIARGELPPGWVSGIRPPKSPIRTAADLIEYLTPFLERWNSDGDDPDFSALPVDEQVSEIERWRTRNQRRRSHIAVWLRGVIQNAVTAIRHWGTPSIPEEFVLRLPTGTPIIHSEANSGEWTETVFSEEECHIVGATLAEIVYILREQQIESELQEYLNASDVERARLMGTAVISSQRNAKAAGDVHQEQIDRIIAYLQSHRFATGRELADMLGISEGYFFNKFPRRLPAFVKNEKGRGYYIEKDDVT